MNAERLGLNCRAGEAAMLVAMHSGVSCSRDNLGHVVRLDRLVGHQKRGGYLWLLAAPFACKCGLEIYGLFDVDLMPMRMVHGVDEVVQRVGRPNGRTA